eukprot:6214112-Pleurochrysis_carterae.AAC.1
MTRRSVSAPDGAKCNSCYRCLLGTTYRCSTPMRQPARALEPYVAAGCVPGQRDHAGRNAPFRAALRPRSGHHLHRSHPNRAHHGRSRGQAMAPAHAARAGSPQRQQPLLPQTPPPSPPSQSESTPAFHCERAEPLEYQTECMCVYVLH